jgi:hypothetical protein
MSMQIQENLVREITANISSNWEKITVNIEIDNVSGEIVSSEESEVWDRDVPEEFDLTFEASEYFEELRETMAKSDAQNRAWTICDLEILSNGAFNFEFSYDKPPRLSTLG